MNRQPSQTLMSCPPKKYDSYLRVRKLNIDLIYNDVTVRLFTRPFKTNPRQTSDF